MEENIVNKNWMLSNVLEENASQRRILKNA